MSKLLPALVALVYMLYNVDMLYYATVSFPVQVKEIYLKEASDALEEKRIAELALVEAKKGR